MTLYMVSIALHVLVAVLGVGVVGAVPLTARFARKSGAVPESGRVLAALLRTMQVAFAVILVTGVLLDVSVGGAFHRTTWLKVSIGVLLVIGFSHARARAALRRALAPGGAPEPALRQVEGWGWTMCAAVGVITVLMELKPLP